jgi:L-ascorbate metabolism protein UlaG (beta-lactamase superfamily)
MRTKLSVLFICVFAVSGWSVAQAQNVTITPLGSQQGEFCVGDRALLFQDPTGVRILTAPGRTVNGSTDPRLPNPSDPSGGVHVVLIDHPHADHIGDVFFSNCAGTTTTPFKFPAQGNTPEVVSGQKSVLPVGGEMGSYFTQKIKDVSGTAPAGCPVATTGESNVVTVPRTAPCVTTLRGGTITVTFAGQSKGVKITTIPAWHAAGAPANFVDAPGVAPGLTGYQGSETGYIIRFTNGLTVLWTGDSGLISDWATDREFYKPNLAVIHSDGLFTMSVGEAVFAVDHLIRPVTVITEHLNQVSTVGGVVVPGTRLEAFINEERHAKIMVPLSGMPISCDGEGNCTGAGGIRRGDDDDHDDRGDDRRKGK